MRQRLSWMRETDDLLLCGPVPRPTAPVNDLTGYRHERRPFLSNKEQDHGQNPSDRPNVIVFFTDQQRWDAAGALGNPLELMPNFDRMATQAPTSTTASLSPSAGRPAPHCRPVFTPPTRAVSARRYQPDAVTLGHLSAKRLSHRLYRQVAPRRHGRRRGSQFRSGYDDWLGPMP